MKKIILYKPANHIQLGHLYGHLFCDALTNLFRGNHLFAYVDYHIDGKTYYAGYVRLEINLYTANAEVLERGIYTMRPSFSDGALSAALLQIMAEKFADVELFDDAVITELDKISASPWVELSKFSSNGFTKLRQHQKHFKLKDRSSRHFGTLNQAISIPKQFIDLNPNVYLPLFAELSHVLRLNLQEDISMNSFCYTVDDWFKTSPRPVEINHYRIDKRQATSITTEIGTTRALLSSMKAHGCIDRLYEFLHNATLDEPLQTPDDELVLKKTDMVVGPLFWKSEATLERLHEVLNEIEVEFKLGKSVGKLRVRDS